MLQRRIFNTIWVSLILFFALYRPEAGYSREYFSLTVSPSIQEFTLTPTNKLTTKIQIQNKGLLPMPTAIEMFNFTYDSKGEPLYLEKEDVLIDATAWINTSSSSVIIESDEKQQIELELEIPDGVPDGSYVVAIMFKPLPPKEYFVSHTSPTLGYISTLVGINVGDPVVGKKGKVVISEFRYQKQQESFAIKVENSSMYYHRASAEIVIKDWRGKTVTQIPIDSVTIMPDKIREVIINKQDSLFPGKYSARVISEDTSIGSSGEIDFYVYPSLIHYLIVIVVSCVVLMICFFLIRHKKKSPLR